MTTFVSNLFAINGVISTDKSVMDNLNTMCSAAGAYLTYDISEGKWSVIINRPGTSVASFDDSNILGGINISGTGVSELYNAVTIEFPHKDLRDQTDYIDFEIDSADRFPNELDNRLNISIECVNDPIQAGYIAASELKQSRVDKIIEFRTDYTNLGLKAGDLIDVTNSVYAYTNKMFRIIKVEEADEEGLVISISALEYDANVYSTAGLIRKIREKKTGIVPKDANTAITRSDNAATTNQLANALNDPTNALLIASLLSAFAKNIGGGGGQMVAYETFQLKQATSYVQSVFNTYAGTPTYGGTWTGNTTVYSFSAFALDAQVRTLLVNIQTPIGSWDYQFYNSKTNSVETRTGLYSYIPCQIDIIYNGNIIQTNTVDWQTPNIMMQLSPALVGEYYFVFRPLQTYDLDQHGTQDVYPYNFSISPQSSGGGITINAYAFFA